MVSWCIKVNTKCKCLKIAKNILLKSKFCDKIYKVIYFCERVIILVKKIPEQHVQRAHLKNLKELIDYGASEYKDKTAFRYRKGDQIIDVSFARLKHDVDSFMAYLFKKDIRHGKRIAVLGENSYEWIVTYFAVANSGNIIIPIDKELKPAEISVLLNDSESVILVYSAAKEKCVEEIKEIGVSTEKFVCIDEFENVIGEGREFLKAEDGTLKTEEIDEEAVCAIIYTSGTTGDPKGVMLSHKNLASDAYYSMSCMIIPDTTVAILPLNHTFGFMASVICQLWMGHSIFINSSLKNVLRDIQEAKPKHVSMVPLFVENFYKNIWKAVDKKGKTKAFKALIKTSNALRAVGIDMRKKFFKSVIDNFGGNLEMIISGGAPISDKYMKGFDDLGITIINGYGITECSPIVSLNRNNNIKYGTVGNPIPNVEVKIENPGSDGEGEIWVRGDIVMLGYYKKPEETAKVMKDGWFNTGDIGKLDDGFLSITGRKKNLIILDNGKNVYPEEIETLILAVENVTEVVVYQDDDMIVAEIYSDAEENLDAVKEQIKNDVQEINKSLAGYKQVKKIRFRKTEFDKTTTKKIKRMNIKKK